ncbi:MAG: hypothetical protein ACI9NG_002622 [Hyphomonas sp.]|jgi:hypothetical protein
MAIACAPKNAGTGRRFPSAFQCNARGFLEKSDFFSARGPGRAKFAASEDVPMEARRDMNTSWPFARTRRESKAAVPLVALSQLGSPVWGGRDAAALTQDCYLRNAVAYRCVRMVAEAAASVPLVTQHDRAAKLLRQPAPDMAGASFLEGVYTQVQLAGNAFVEAVQIDGRTGIAASG